MSGFEYHPAKVPSPEAFRRLVQQLDSQIAALDADHLHRNMVETARNFPVHFNQDIREFLRATFESAEGLASDSEATLELLMEDSRLSDERIQQLLRRLGEIKGDSESEEESPGSDAGASRRTVQQHEKLHKPVGHRMLRLADLLYSKGTYERVFEAAVLDYRAEHHEALAQGDRLKARIRRAQLAGVVAGLAVRHAVQKLVKPFEPVVSMFGG